MIKVKRLSTIFIWYGLTIYTLFSIGLTKHIMVDSHYINWGLLGVATISFFWGLPIGQLTTLLMLVIGFFGRGAVFISVYYFKLFGLKVYWPYLPLIRCN